RTEESADRHRRDHMRALVTDRHAVGLGRDRDRLPVSDLDLAHAGVEGDLGAARRHELGGTLPHHPRAVLRVVELLDQARYLLRLVLLAPERLGLVPLPRGTKQAQVADPLGAPVSLDLGARHAPALLALGLEEVPVQAPSEPRCDEALERGLVLRRMDPHPEVRRDASNRLDWTEVAQ